MADLEKVPIENPHKIKDNEERLKELTDERDKVNKTLEKLLEKVDVETKDWKVQRETKENSLSEMQIKVNDAKSKVNKN